MRVARVRAWARGESVDALQEPQPHVRSGGGDSSHKTAVGCLLQHQTVPCRTWLNTVEETRQVGRPCAAARCAATSVSSVQTTWEQSDEWGVELRGMAREDVCSMAGTGATQGTLVAAPCPHALPTSWNPALIAPPVSHSICLPACSSRQPSGMRTCAEQEGLQVEAAGVSDGTSLAAAGGMYGSVAR